ncbi:MAG: peptide ABC transporter substrate-binding protein [Verrucomicrobiota bacterium]|jgi:oligopeptide transport system substrate-binding protein
MIFPERVRRFLRRTRFLFCTSVAAMATGCGRHEPPADVTILNMAEPESLDPAIITAQSDMRIVSGMFEGLTRLEPVAARAVPGLAERWEISPDGRTYTFHLRTNLMWSTGEPITARDVVYSWIRELNPETASDYAGQLYYVKNGENFNTGKIKDASLVGVHALDAFAVQVELNHPTLFFLDLCAMPLTCVVPRQTIEKYGDRWLNARPLPVSGAFELESWRLNDRVRLRKNPRYWDTANTQSEIIDILPIGTPNTALNLYDRGQADIVWDKELIPSELVDVLLQRPDFHSYPYLGTYFVRFNVTRKPFDDPRVRQALALAVDKERIVKKITKAGETPTSHLVPAGTAHYSPPEGLGYDPERARQLLAEAGYPGGKGFPRFEYLFDSGSGGLKIHEDIAIEMQQMWHNELGIEMDLRQVETQVFWGMLSRIDFTVSRSSWIADYNDANTFLGMFVTGDGNNETGWGNARYDNLVHAANETVDAAEREKDFQQAEKILVHDELPILPLYIYEGINYFDTNKVTGIWQNLLDDHPLRTIRKHKA